MNINDRLETLAEYIRMEDELKAEIESLRDEIKAYMQETGTDTIIGTGHKATWKTVKSNRFDGAALKADAPELYKAYVKETETKRFTFS